MHFQRMRTSDKPFKLSMNEYYEDDDESHSIRKMVQYK